MKEHAMEKLSISYETRNPLYQTTPRGALIAYQTLIHEAILETIRNLPERVCALVKGVVVNNDNAHEILVVTFSLEGSYRSCDPANETWRHPARVSVDFKRKDMNLEKILEMLRIAICNTLKERLHLIRQHSQELERLAQEM